MAKHIAVIPARMGSVAFKFKNRILFDQTVAFLNNVEWFDRVIVSTDDPVVADAARREDYEVHQRATELAGPAVSVKAVFEAVIAEMAVAPDDVLWLFYLPVLFKRRSLGPCANGRPFAGRVLSNPNAPVLPLVYASYRNTLPSSLPSCTRDVRRG